MAREESTKSNLIKLLQRISRGSSPRIGLVPAKEQVVPALALMVALDQADAQACAAAVAGGADALVVPQAQAMARWNELVAVAAGKPVGLQLDEGSLTSAGDLKQLTERADFVIANAESAPAALLELDGAGKVLAVDEEYAPQLIRTLGELPVDAVLAQAKREGGTALTVRDVLHFRQVVDLVRRPVIGIVDQRFSPSLLKLFREMGLEAVLLPVAAAGGAEYIRNAVVEYRKVIDGLGRPIGRAREFGQALVPHVAPATGPAVAEPEEEPDDDQR